MAEPIYLYGRPVHNHGPSEGRGLDCGETTAVDGYPMGWCLAAGLVPTSPDSGMFV